MGYGSNVNNFPNPYYNNTNINANSMDNNPVKPNTYFVNKDNSNNGSNFNNNNNISPNTNNNNNIGPNSNNINTNQNPNNINSNMDNYTSNQNSKNVTTKVDNYNNHIITPKSDVESDPTNHKEIKTVKDTSNKGGLTAKFEVSSSNKLKKANIKLPVKTHTPDYFKLQDVIRANIEIGQKELDSNNISRCVDNLELSLYYLKNIIQK